MPQRIEIEASDSEMPGNDTQFRPQDIIAVIPVEEILAPCAVDSHIVTHMTSVVAPVGASQSRDIAQIPQYAYSAPHHVDARIGIVSISVGKMRQI